MLYRWQRPGRSPHPSAIRRRAPDTGYRAFSRKVLLEVPFLRNSLDFAFDTELLMQAAHFGFRFHEVPCATIYNNEASSVSFRQGVVYGVKSLGAGARLVLHRRGIWRSKKFQA